MMTLLLDSQATLLTMAIGLSAAGGPAATRASDDERAVAAVAKNDAATMDRILADNFVLVTGSGKVFTKTDLLNEARAGATVYERQDDSSQKVRVWGDTAVITALLSAKGTEGESPSSTGSGSAIPTSGHRPGGATCSARLRLGCPQRADAGARYLLAWAVASRLQSDTCSASAPSIRRLAGGTEGS